MTAAVADIEVTREELLNLLDDGEKVATAPWRHGRRETYHVMRDGADYLVTVDVHHEEGIQVYGTVTLRPAEKRTRTVEEWVECK